MVNIFPTLKGYCLLLELCFFVYNLIVCFYNFDASNDSSLYILKTKTFWFLKKIYIYIHFQKRQVSKYDITLM